MASEVIVVKEAKVHPLNAVKPISNTNLEEVFGVKPQPRMQDKLHDMMYSGHTVSVDEGIRVSINGLIPTQKYMSASLLHNYSQPRQFDDLPIVATYKGKNYVIDGHHRIAAAILRGERATKVIRYNLE